MLLLLFTSLACSQSAKEVKRNKNLQSKHFVRAENSLNDNRIREAYSILGIVKKIDSTSTYGIIATRKSDSIRKTTQKSLSSKVIGSWQLISKGSNWGHTNISDEESEILKIKNNTLKFFKLNDKNQFITKKTEKKQFYNKTGTSYDTFDELIFSDNKIWRISLKNNSQTLELINTGEAIENSRTLISCGYTILTYKKIQ